MLKMLARIGRIAALCVALFAFSAMSPPSGTCSSEGPGDPCDIRCTCLKTGNAQCPGSTGTGCTSPLCEKIWLGE